MAETQRGFENCPTSAALVGYQRFVVSPIANCQLPIANCKFRICSRRYTLGFAISNWEGALMPWIIGVDEAGYGPNLGPLVMTSVACRIPEELTETNLWKVLKEVVRRQDDSED